jgi:hypothetical protein
MCFYQWQWYYNMTSNITITILDIIHLLLKTPRFGDRFYFHLQVETTQLGPINRTSLSLRRQRRLQNPVSETLSFK